MYRLDKNQLGWDRILSYYTYISGIVPSTDTDYIWMYLIFLKDPGDNQLEVEIFT